MANQWFRFYSEFADDPKVQMMSEAMQRRLVMLFCSRCKGETLQKQELAFHWRVTETEVEQTLSVFIEKGFIDEQLFLLNWNRRQFISDSSTERVRAHRAAKKQDETLQKQSVTEDVTPPEQNRTEQNRTKTEKKRPCVFDACAIALPDYVSKTLWDEFVENRQKKKKPLTEKTSSLALNRLIKAYADGLDVTHVMEEAVLGMWESFHPKPDGPKRKKEYRVVTGAEFWADVPGVETI